MAVRRGGARSAAARWRVVPTRCTAVTRAGFAPTGAAPARAGGTGILTEAAEAPVAPVSGRDPAGVVVMAGLIAG
jgi:hypothetical protein